ncbi:MAG: hypothetical protein GY749_48195 [Desulfobacteraceae bacterium]|nr:hypothetical protein [Desulfobacteraceae bacterium]
MKKVVDSTDNYLYSQYMAAQITFKIDKKIKDDFRILCIRNDITMKDILISFMKKSIDNNEFFSDIVREREVVEEKNN